MFTTKCGHRSAEHNDYTVSEFYLSRLTNLKLVLFYQDDNVKMLSGMKREIRLGSLFFPPGISSHSVPHNLLFLVSGIEVKRNILLKLLVVTKINMKPETRRK